MIVKCIAWIFLCSVSLGESARAQEQAVDAPHPEERDKAEHKVEKQEEKIAKNANVEIVGEKSFKEKELISQLKEQITSISELGLTAARADDAAFFLELFYRKNGFPKVEVKYSMPGGNRLRLEINEGPRVTIGDVEFVGNQTLSADKLFEYLVGPTRERYSKAEKKLPYVKSDLDEGVDLVRRIYVSEGFLNVIVQAPNVRERDDNIVDLSVAIVEGNRYSFGGVIFSGNTIYGAEKLRAEIADILAMPYTDRRVADIPRRLQAYYKARGYYSVKVDAAGSPDVANGGHVPVRVTVSPGAIHYFDGASVSGLQRLRPSFVEKRFGSLSGKTYSPDLLDEKFRELMKTGLFSVLQIKPREVEDDRLHLDIAAEEAKSKEFGFSLGYGTYAGLIAGVSYRDRDMFGYGRPVTTSLEYSDRGYKGEIDYEDPWLFDTENHLKLRLYSLTFDYDGYSKLELGARLDLTRDITKQYKIGAVLTARHVEITSASIPSAFLGRTSYQVTSIGYTQTLDLRKSPLVSPRGLVFDNTLDYATSALGSQIDFVRATARASYFIPFAPEKKNAEVNAIDDEQESKLQHWFRQSLLAFGARAGVIEGVNGTKIPIDERFFNGGANTVRSFGERDLGPHVGGDPIGGEFFSVYNVEYTFPIFGELQGAVFVDAGNLLPNADDAGFDNMRYGVGFGLRYKLPIGPLRLDYGVNPDRRPDEDFGAFHFSFGFAF
ncbi:MAG: BamA/TamA family outer membrane protein [Verrucomicrobiota bacterium]|nr:BamA/TamA family outer membrane protein [Verrucomicrobiota bacterium]